MQTQNQNTPLLVVINSTGAQSSSVVHAASAAGFHVRAQVRSASKPEAKALESLPNVTLAEGSIDDASFLSTLFKDADYAWVNTTFFQQDETKLGKDLALAAKNAGVKHYIYSSLSDHSKITNGKWRNPIWVAKFAVEKYIRTLENFPATFVYSGCYLQNFNHNHVANIKRQEDGSILISGKFSPDAKVPFIDTDRDLGPAVVKILKEGPAKWNQKRVPLAFEKISMNELAKKFSDSTGLKVIYQQTSKELDPANFIDIIFGVFNDDVYFDWDCKVPDEARELNPNWHSAEDFAKNMWKKPEA